MTREIDAQRAGSRSRTTPRSRAARPQLRVGSVGPIPAADPTSGAFGHSFAQIGVFPPPSPEPATLAHRDLDAGRSDSGTSGSDPPTCEAGPAAEIARHLNREDPVAGYGDFPRAWSALRDLPTDDALWALDELARCHDLEVLLAEQAQIGASQRERIAETLSLYESVTGGSRLSLADLESAGPLLLELSGDRLDELVYFVTDHGGAHDAAWDVLDRFVALRAFDPGFGDPAVITFFARLAGGGSRDLAALRDPLEGMSLADLRALSRFLAGQSDVGEEVVALVDGLRARGVAAEEAWTRAGEQPDLLDQILQGIALGVEDLGVSLGETAGAIVTGDLQDQLAEAIFEATQREREAGNPVAPLTALADVLVLEPVEAMGEHAGRIYVALEEGDVRTAVQLATPALLEEVLTHGVNRIGGGGGGGRHGRETPEPEPAPHRMHPDEPGAEDPRHGAREEGDIVEEQGAYLEGEDRTLNGGRDASDWIEETRNMDPDAYPFRTRAQAEAWWELSNRGAAIGVHPLLRRLADHTASTPLTSARQARHAFRRWRRRFWRRVWDDPEARSLFERAGFVFERRGRAPVDPRTGEALTIEHQVRIADDYTRALDPDNMVLSPFLENSKLLEGMRRREGWSFGAPGIAPPGVPPGE